MKRKLVRQGTSTLMISLPSKWVQKNNLNKGSEVDLEEKDNSLTISPGSIKSQVKSATIDVSGMSPLINRSLIALYISGVDEIEVQYKDNAEIKDFQKRIISELLGFEILKQTQKGFILKDVTGCEKQDIDELIKRVFLILDSIVEEILSNIKNKKKMDSVIEADSSINRLTHFCLRILNKKGYPVYSKTNQIYGILNLLEEVGDCYKKIAKESNKVTKQQITELENSREMLKIFSELTFGFDKSKAVHCAKLYQHSVSRLENKSLMDNYILQLLDSIIRINNYLLVFSLGKE